MDEKTKTLDEELCQYTTEELGKTLIFLFKGIYKGTASDTEKKRFEVATDWLKPKKFEDRLAIYHEIKNEVKKYISKSEPKKCQLYENMLWYYHMHILD